MTFLDSVNTCLKKTLTISGRASRSEFWWFQLSFFVIGLIVGLIVAALGADSTLALIIGIMTLISGFNTVSAIMVLVLVLCGL